MTMPSPTTRRYVYGIAIAVLPLLITYGIVAEDAAPQWVAVLGAILVPGLAVVNVQDEELPGGEGYQGEHRAT